MLEVLEVLVVLVVLLGSPGQLGRWLQGCTWVPSPGQGAPGGTVSWEGAGLVHLRWRRLVDTDPPFTRHVVMHVDQLDQSDQPP